jgi:ppGpp synthetase/RelA/SpoT-type nucleotidyltranferase
MAFPKPPNYTDGVINRAGKALVTNPTDEHSQHIVSEWRACHAYPINTFQATLRDKLHKLNLDATSLVAQRLKRMPSIVDKLKRFPRMNLVQMQDIGGLRAVVDCIVDVRKLQESY